MDLRLNHSLQQGGYTHAPRIAEAGVNQPFRHNASIDFRGLSLSANSYKEYAGDREEGSSPRPRAQRPYSRMTVLHIMAERLGWLQLFFLGLLLTTLILAGFKAVLEKDHRLSFFLPLIIGHAGNSGSQSVSTIIRAVALGEIGRADTMHILGKECLTVRYPVARVHDQRFIAVHFCTLDC